MVANAREEFIISVLLKCTGPLGNSIIAKVLKISCSNTL